MGLSQPETGIQGNSGRGCVDGAVGTSVPRRVSTISTATSGQALLAAGDAPAFSVGDLAEPMREITGICLRCVHDQSDPRGDSDVSVDGGRT